MFVRTMCLAAFATVVSAACAADEIRPGVFRTPDARFENLPDFDFEPHYKDINGYRIHYLDEGPSGAEPILLLHGEPTWSYLYRKMIPVLTAAGYRCIAPDLIGFGRSDKPAKMETHTYKLHVDAIAALVEALDLERITMFGQDWGGLIGLRLVAENPGRFARIVVSNTGLPAGEGAISPAFAQWRRMNQTMIDSGDMNPGAMVAFSSGSRELADAYNAPFPDSRYKAGPLIMPQLVPITPDDPAVEANKKAWDVLRRWEKPCLTVFGDSDPVTGGQEVILQERIPGAKGQPHTIIEGAGHFIQESHGEEVAAIIAKFIADTKSSE